MLALDRIWDVFVRAARPAHAQVIGPFDESLRVAPHDLQRSNSTFLTLLVQQLRALWDLGFCFASYESLLVNDVPLFYDVSKIVPVSGMTEAELATAIAALQQLFPPSVAILSQTFRLPRFFEIEPISGVRWELFDGVPPAAPAVLTCETLGVDELLGEFSFDALPRTAGAGRRTDETAGGEGVSSEFGSETPAWDGVSPQTSETPRSETAEEPSEFDGEFRSETPSRDERRRSGAAVASANKHEKESEKESEKEINSENESENEIKNENEIEVETIFQTQNETQNETQTKTQTQIQSTLDNEAKSCTDSVESVETIDTHSESAVFLSPRDEPSGQPTFPEVGFSKEFPSESSPVSLEPDFESVGSHSPFSSQVNALFHQDFHPSFDPRDYSLPWRRSQDTIDALCDEKPRGSEEAEDVEEMEEERRSVSLHSLLSEFPEQEGTLRRRGRLLYHGDEDEDVRNAVCMEVVAASMKQIAGLLGMEERAADAGELRESVMGMGKQGEKTTVMEMIPEENAEEGEGEATGNMWNTGCGKD